jgi:hypothetical protein
MTAADDAFRSFVAGLYAARGRTVEREGDRLVVSTGDRTRRVAVLDEASWTGTVPADADAAVVAADLDDPTPTVTDAASLHQQLLYAVDRADASALLDSHFGRSPESLSSPTVATVAETGGDSSTASGQETETTDRGDRVASRLPDDPRLAVVTLAVVGCLLLSGVLFAIGGLAAGGTSSTEPALPATTTAVEPSGTDDIEPAAPDERRTRVSTESPRNDSSATVTWADAVPAFPPGVTSEGIADERDLVAAHRSILEDNSYHLTLTYREFVDGHATGVHVERIRVASDSRYVVSTTRTGEFHSVPRTIADADRFANGSALFQREDDRVRVKPLRRDASDPFLDDVARYLRWYLSVGNAAVEAPSRVDGGLYRITTTGDPYPGVQNATGTAFVTDRGLVRDIRRVHDLRSRDVRVVVRMRVTGVGETAVRRPPWTDGDQPGS